MKVWIENKIFCTIMYYDYLGSMELTVGLLMLMAIVSYLHLKWIRWPKDRRLQMIRTGIYIIMIEAANHVEIEIRFLVYQQNEVTDIQIKSCLRNKIRVMIRKSITKCFIILLFSKEGTFFTWIIPVLFFCRYKRTQYIDDQKQKVLPKND